jgi:O-antigen ligase
MDLVLNKIDSRISWLVKILLGLCLVTPLFITSSLLFPYTSIKAFSFRIFVEIAAVFYFYLALKYPDFRPKKTALIIAVGAFLLVWLLSSILGVDSYLSFWGNLERMLGFIGLLHFAAFFLMLAGVFKTEKSWLGLLKISVAASTVISLLAVTQRFTGLGLLMPQQGRVYGTVGNAAFLASYLIFNIFFAGYLIFRSSAQEGKFKNRQTFLWSASFLLQLAALFLTGTRGALVGLGAGVIFCLIFFVLFYPAKNIRKYFLAILMIILILGASLFALRNSAFVRSNPDLNRIASISIKDVTAQNRLVLWQKAWSAWQEHPFFGWGPENYEVAINKYFDARLLPYETWYDRAHNLIFDYGVAGGWAGLAAYLALLATAVFYLKKISRRDFFDSQKPNENKFKNKQSNEADGISGINIRIFILAVLLGGTILAYLVQNLFVFDTFVSYLLLFFVLALINFYYTVGSQRKSDESKINVTSLNLGKKILLISLAIVVTFSIYFLNIKPISASFIGNQILSLDAQNYRQAEPLLKKAVELNTFGSDEIVYQTALDYLEKIQSSPQLTEDENFYKLVSSYLARTIERSPAQSRNYVALAWMNLYFSNKNPDRINLAIEEAQKIKALSPIKKDSYLILVAAFSLNNEKQKAENEIAQAQQIDPALGQQVEDYYNNLNKN